MAPHWFYYAPGAKYATTRFTRGQFLALREAAAKQGGKTRELFELICDIHGRVGRITASDKDADTLRVKFPEGSGVTALPSPREITVSAKHMELIELAKPKFKMGQAVFFDYGLGIVTAIYPAWRTAPTGYAWYYTVHYIKDGEVLRCPDSRCPTSQGDPYAGSCAICSRGLWADALQSVSDSDLAFLQSEGMVPPLPPPPEEG